MTSFESSHVARVSFFYRVLALLMFQCTISILILVKVETLVHKLPHLMLLKILHYANHILVSCSFVLVCGPDSFIRLICYFVCANDGLSLVIQLRSRLIAKMI